MNRLAPLLAAAAFLAVCLHANSAPAARVLFERFSYEGKDELPGEPLQTGQYRNPILAGFYPDPSLCKVGDDYYLVNSTFAYFPGLPIFHSKDLVHWKLLGHAIDRPGQLNYEGLAVSQGLFAPSLSYHDGRFYLICTHVGKGGNFFVTATNPAGPWSEPVWLDFDGIDPSLFFDDDGRAWMVNNGNPPDNKPLYQGHRAIWLQEFDVAGRKLVGPRRIIINGGVDLAAKPVWIEGPHIFKRDGWYYLTCAEGGTSVNHSQVIFRSRTPEGPFVPWKNNPILTQRDLDGSAPHSVTCTGHASLVPGPDGRWWSVFLGCRPIQEPYQFAGRETFLLPVTWTEDGWPRILPQGERVPLVQTAPVTSAPMPPTQPLTGNFSWSDGFDEADGKLRPEWLAFRVAPTPWWSLSEAPGRLAVEPRSEALAGTGAPAFLGRRVQHARFDAEVTFELPRQSGVSAGLVLFQSGPNHFYFHAVRGAAGVELRLETAEGAAPRLVESRKLSPAETLALRLRGEGLSGTLEYALGDGSWQTFRRIDLKPYTTEAAGSGLHFTGATVGLHARREP